MLRKLKNARDILIYLGPNWALQRCRFVWERRTGALKRRLPMVSWSTLALTDYLIKPELTNSSNYLQYRRQDKCNFFFSSRDFQSWSSTLRGFDTSPENSPVELANNILSGKFLVFSRRMVDPGFPPDWHHNIATGKRGAQATTHFTQIGDFSQGDIKGIWELSRFSFTFPLVRAFARTGDDRYAEAFWQLFESWCEANPPNAGTNWKCGQETAFRLMAWVFGFFAFLHARATTAERTVRFGIAVAKSAERISAHIDYALSQQNNHGISEAAGLFTAGLLFPEFRDAEKWRGAGAQHLENLARDLIYEDGAFSQNSFNYQRVALHDFLWCIRLAELHRQPLAGSLQKRVFKSAEFLFQMQDPVSGWLPNYGHNDGAQVLQLSNCDYSDFRPVLQLAGYCEKRKIRYGTRGGPWNEELLWLYGINALDAESVEASRSELAAPRTGYYRLRGANSFVFIRYPHFFHRPGQADLLHCDLWYKGHNVAADPGTFSYNAEPPWDNELERTRYHNTITLGLRDQMRKASRFLWVPWPKAEVRYRQSRNDVSYIEGEHHAYKPAVHRRAILRLPDDMWVILDQVHSAREPIRLHWLLASPLAVFDEAAGRVRLEFPEGEYYYQLASSPGASITSSVAEAGSVRGWISRYYLEKEPAFSLEAVVESPQALFYSVFGPTPVQLHASRSGLRLDGKGIALDLSLSDRINRPLLGSVRGTVSGSDVSTDF